MFSVEPGLSTDGPLVRLKLHGVQYFAGPEEATALALDLVAATAVARYEAALAEVLDNPDEATSLTAAVRARLTDPPQPEVS